LALAADQIFPVVGRPAPEGNIRQWREPMRDAVSFHFAQHFLLDSVVIVFVVSGTAKLLALHTFRFGLQLLPLMPAPLAAMVSFALPIAELVLAAFLFMNHSWAKYAAIGMLIVFSGVALVAVGMGRQVPCGCFGQLDGQTLSLRTVFRNGFLILLVVAVLGFERRTEWLLMSLWPTGFFLLAGLSLVRIYNNHQLIVGLRKAKLL
jgi:drug/metabolite transporter (DMT)-like permease